MANDLHEAEQLDCTLLLIGVHPIINLHPPLRGDITLLKNILGCIKFYRL